MVGKPPLWIGQHGKITRTALGGGVWLAHCRFRDTDGVTRRVERRCPTDANDQYGKLAEGALTEALKSRRAPGTAALDRAISERINVDWLTLWCPHQGSNLGPAD